MTTSSPTSGFWLRVTPENSFDGETVKVVTVIEAGDQLWVLDCIGSGSYVSDDPKGTIYYPLSKDILKASAAMADAILHDNPCGEVLEELAEDYQATVAKAVKP